MLSEFRIRIAQTPSKRLPVFSDVRRASVAAILRGAPSGPEILLIRRATRKGDPWSGQMAFPGGRSEPQDDSLVATVCRETREEIGLDLRATAHLLGALDEVDATIRGASTGLIVTPFVFELEQVDPLLMPNDEVADTCWTPIGPLIRGERSAEYTYVHRGKPIQMPAYAVGDQLVWGLTHRMLCSLFELVQDASDGP